MILTIFRLILVLGIAGIHGDDTTTVESRPTVPASILRKACEKRGFERSNRNKRLIKEKLQTQAFQPCSGFEHIILKKYQFYQPFTQAAIVNQLKCENRVFSNRAADKTIRTIITKFSRHYK